MLHHRFDIPRKTPNVLCSKQDSSQASGQCDCACDCACSLFTGTANQNNRKIHATIPIDTHRRYYSTSSSLNLDKTHSVYYGIRHRPVVLNRSASLLLSLFYQSHALDDIPEEWRRNWGNRAIQATLKQLIELGLLIPKARGTPTLNENPSMLTAWLHITDRCNLRCSYCYLPHTRTDMSVETGRAAINAVFRSAQYHNYHQVKLKYAGGEPLLNFSRVSELHQYARRLARRYHLKLDGILLSNGTLLSSKILQTMQTLGLRLMISLDGLYESHHRRRYADGKSSVADTLSAIELALTHDLIPDISVTVCRQNIKGLPELTAWLLDRNLPFSLNFYRENDCSVSQSGLWLQEGEMISGMKTVYQEIEKKLPPYSLLNSLVDRTNLLSPHLRTCNACQSYLVIDSLGRICQCQMNYGHPVTNIQASDPLAVIRTAKQGLQNIPVEEKDGCQDCEWKYWCAGGCPFVTFRATGRYDVKSPNCHIYKALYPEAMRLEGLRLIKYAA